MSRPVDAERAIPPWSPPKRRLLVAGNALAAGLILGACWGAAGTDLLGDQVGWVNLAVAGLLASGATNAGWLFSGRRAVGQRRRRVVPDVATVAVSGSSATVVLPGAEPGTRLWVPGTIRTHRAGCRLVAGKATTAVDERAVRRRGLQPCEVCT